ncbi:hypothetical protein LTS18_010949, partial [Coniosporium uncinatum]
MDLSNIVTGHEHQTRRSQTSNGSAPQHSAYPARNPDTSYSQSPIKQEQNSVSGYGLTLGNVPTTSYTRQSTQRGKSVSFELLLASQKARLPMRVNIFPHDSTESIVTTVKNFYGLYEGQAVSFEDRNHNTLIARFENLEEGMTVFVKTIDEDAISTTGPASIQGLSPRRPRLDAPFQMLPPQGYGNNLSRPSSRNARKRSNSPTANRGRRSESSGTNPKSRSRPSLKNRANSTQGSVGDANGDDYSDSDGGNGSVTSSRRGRNDVASAEISVENIVEGGRRKRAKFESS